MSPHVGNFVADLVEMAKATEMLPQVQAELSEARATIDHQSATIQRLELKLLERNGEIDSLNAKLRDAEVARDDAELRFLEVEDKLGRVVNLVRGMGETLGQAIVTAEPERQPTPMPMPTPETNPPTPAPEVVQPVNPIASSTVGDGPSPETATVTPSVETSADASLASPGPYHGRTWSQVRAEDGHAPYSREDWALGGGSEEDFYQ